MDRQGASGAAIAGILIVVVILIVVFYGVNHGMLNLGKPSSSAVPSSFSISATVNSTSIYPGHSAPMYIKFFNPFSQPLNVNLQVSVGAPNYVSISPSSKSLVMPANMKNASTASFNVSCTGSSVSSTYLFSSEISNFQQNLTTSVITYPYGTQSSLIPQTIYTNSNQGFMSLSATPASVETQIPSGSLSTTINLDILPVYDGGHPYTQISHGTPNNLMTSITIKITNSSGIASAFVYYNGQNYPFSVSGRTLSLTLSNGNLALTPLPIEITATNDNSTSQNIISINTNYNYYFSFTGSPSEISCA